MSNVNWEALKGQLGQDLASALEGIVEGAVSDVQTFANQIASELVMAVQSEDQEAIVELRAQLDLIAEINRVRVSQAQVGMVLKVVNVAVAALTSGLIAAGVQAIKPSA